MGRLTTHVLDTACGKPAAAMPVRLFRVSENQTRECLCEAITNKDGRTDKPLLDESFFTSGTYEIDFKVDTYFARSGLPISSPPFFDSITLRFTVSDPQGSFHVPLLVSPWSYSTYRGS